MFISCIVNIVSPEKFSAHRNKPYGLILHHVDLCCCDSVAELVKI